MDPHYHRYPHGVHLSALTERNSRRVWSDDASNAEEAAITNKNCSFFEHLCFLHYLTKGAFIISEEAIASFSPP